MIVLFRCLWTSKSLLLFLYTTFATVYVPGIPRDSLQIPTAMLKYINMFAKYHGLSPHVVVSGTCCYYVEPGGTLQTNRIQHLKSCYPSTCPAKDDRPGAPECSGRCEPCPLWLAWHQVADLKCGLRLGRLLDTAPSTSVDQSRR